MPAPAPPTAKQWEYYRPEICQMYKQRPLKAIKTHMLETYGFHATERMYKGRFKSWGIAKNRRHVERPTVVSQDIQAFLAASPPPESRLAASPDVVTRHELLPDVSNRRSGSIITWRSGSPHFNDPDADNQSTSYTATPRMFPPTPATTGDGSPATPDNEDQGLDADTIRKRIVDLAISMLTTLPLKRAGQPLAEPNGDHVEIFRTLQTKLRHEGKLRGCLLNSQQAVPSSLIDEIVKDMLNPLFPAAPVGVLSIFNQLQDWFVVNELADCLIDSAKSILPPDDDFTQLALAIRRLLDITRLDSFLESMADICDDLEVRLQAVLGRQSLVRVYLVFLLNAKKAKSNPKKDDRVLGMVLERFAHVQHAYRDDAKLILEFNLLVVGYLSIVTPGAPDVANMASTCYNRATEYLADMERSRSKIEIRNAKFHLGKSCAYLADCLNAVGQQHKDEEKRSSARGMLLVSILHHADCAEATYAHVKRQMEKLSKWCKEADDTDRLHNLNLVYDMIEGKEQRPKGEPMLPRLRD